MKGTYIIVGTILLIAALTNPGRNYHIAVITEEVVSSYKEVFGRDIDSGSVGGHGSSTMRETVASVVDVQNFIFFSTAVLTNAGESKTITVGVLGQVFLLHDLDKKYMRLDASSLDEWVRF